MIDVTIKAIKASNLDEKINDQNGKKVSHFLTSDIPVNQEELQKAMIDMGPDCLDKISLLCRNARSCAFLQSIVLR